MDFVLCFRGVVEGWTTPRAAGCRSGSSCQEPAIDWVGGRKTERKGQARMERAKDGALRCRIVGDVDLGPWRLEIEGWRKIGTACGSGRREEVKWTDSREADRWVESEVGENGTVGRDGEVPRAGGVAHTGPKPLKLTGNGVREGGAGG